MRQVHGRLNMIERDAILSMSDEALSQICTIEFFKATGNGGQKRNKTSSAVRVKLDSCGISAEDCSERSQHRNRSVALGKLRMRLAYAIRKEYVPFERCDCAVTHADYPLFVAKLLDLLAQNNWDYRLAAETLGVSSSHLLKVISRDKDLFTCYNKARSGAGLPPVHP